MKEKINKQRRKDLKTMFYTGLVTALGFLFAKLPQEKTEKKEEIDSQKLNKRYSLMNS